MIVFRLALLAAGALMLAQSSSLAADPAHGLALARQWCAACHVVSADQRRASVDAPPFATIARLPNFSAEGIAFFLLDPHPKMPDLLLTRAEAEDIAAYIATLKK